MSLSDRILFIDGEALVIDKPAGLPVDRPRSGGPSIEGRIDELKAGFQRPPVPMHRLDQDTSGCLLLARNSKAVKRFQASFEAGEVRKSYLAVVAGELVDEEGAIDLPLAKISSARDGWRMAVDEDGKPSMTRWRRIASAEGQTLVELRPETGRTHQLRIHAARGLLAPIVGDPVYGGARSGGGAMAGPDCGMLLHAWRLAVPRDPHEEIDVTAHVPERFGRWREYLP
jgi:tRNA pseudouridine32 synthase/23S rRNA pseudouridine746 synthase